MTSPIRRTARRAIALLGLALVGSAVLPAVLAVGPVSTAPAGATVATPPWEPDGNSVGGLTFYNAAGQQITGGNLTDAPLAAYVEGSATVRAGDTKATLFGYLPKSGQSPGQFAGEQLSSSTTFPNASAPAPLTAATLPVVSGAATDETLATLEEDYPNTDTTTDGYAGLYQLRLETSAVGKSANTTYDSADIAVTATTWSVVYPSPTLTTTTTTTVATDPSGTATSGSPVALTATVSPSAPGTVDFKVGSTDLGTATVSGVTASLTTSDLPTGSDTVSAVFTPAQFAAYSGSTGTVGITVTAGTPTTTAVAATPASPQQQGTPVTLSATVSPSEAPGTVQFKVGSTTLGSATVSGGKATLTTSSLPVGSDTVTAVFTPTGSSGYGGSSGITSFTVTPPPPTVTVATVSPAKVTYGTPVTYSATVTSGSGTPTGSVAFSTGSTTLCTATLTAGVASCHATDAPPGTDVVTARYGGATGFAASSGTATLTVAGRTGKGYWLVGADGGILNAGAATFYGSTGALTLNKPIVGIAATPDDRGYWLVASDGGIFAFGDATFYGSTGALTLNKPIVGIAATPDGKGYWLVASDGGIFAFGDATFEGSTGSLTLTKPVVGIAATPDAKGYWLVASDGGIFAFGDAGFYGSGGGLTLAKPIVAMAGA